MDKNMTHLMPLSNSTLGPFSILRTFPRIKTLPFHQVSYVSLGNTFSLRSTMKLVVPLWPASTANYCNALIKHIYQEM